MLRQIFIFIFISQILSCKSTVDYEGVLSLNLNDGGSNASIPFSASLTKISQTNEIFKASDDTNDCSYYLIATKGIGAWRPSTFVFNNKIYIHVPCKYNDAGAGGWHWGFMTWTPGSGANWIDGDTGTSGDNEVLSRSDLDSNGFILNSNRNFYAVETPSGLKGLTIKYFRSSEYNISNVPALFDAKAVVPSNGYYSIPFRASSPENLNSLGILVDEEKSPYTFNEADNSWKGKTYLTAEILYHENKFYVYSSSINAPANDKYYIYLSQSSDLLTFEDPSGPLLENYTTPHVFKYKNKIYMLAFNTLIDKWQLLKGSGPTSFDTDEVVTLDLGVEVFSTSNWDDTPDFTALNNNQPEIAGVEVLNDKVYLFYMAGQFSQTRIPANGSSGAPYDSPRGIGAFELSID